MHGIAKGGEETVKGWLMENPNELFRRTRWFGGSERILVRPDVSPQISSKGKKVPSQKEGDAAGEDF